MQEHYPDLIERLLQESEELFRPLTENVNMVLWVRLPGTDQIVYVSPTYEKIWDEHARACIESRGRLPTRSILKTATVSSKRWRRTNGVVQRRVSDHCSGWIGTLDPGAYFSDPRAGWTHLSHRRIRTRHQRPKESRRSPARHTDQDARTLCHQSPHRRGAHTEDVLSALRSLTTFADASRAFILTFDRPWEDSPPSRCQVLADWRADTSLPSLVGESLDFEEHLFIRLFTREEPLLIHDVKTDPRVSENTRNWLSRIRARSILLFPLITGNQWYGMLTIHFDLPKTMGRRRLTILKKWSIKRQRPFTTFTFWKQRPGRARRQRRQMSSSSSSSR